MKKKVLLTIALVSMFIFAFVIAVSAATPEKYIEFGAKFPGSDEYITVYTENADSNSQRINFDTYKFYSDEEFTQEVDISTVTGLDFTTAKTHGLNGNPVERMTKPSTPFVDCVEVKWFLEGMSCVSYDGAFFYGWAGLKSFDFGNATAIADNTFQGCGFETITIPAQITSIGGSAFRECKSLTSVKFEGDIKKFNNGNTFYLCTALESVDLAPLTSLAKGMFYGCTAIELVDIPAGLTSISNNAFYQTGLTSVTIPNGVTSIGSSAFNNCTELTEVNIPSSVTSIGDSTFKSCTALTSITLPNGLTSISSSAFHSSALTSISIPSTVKTVGGDAFKGCKSLVTVIFEGELHEDGSLGASMFSGCANLESVTLPKNLERIPSSTFWGCRKVQIVNLSEMTELTTIGSSAFQDTMWLVFTLPDTVTTIEASAFQSAFKEGTGGSLTINPTSRLQTIGSNAFNDCRMLTSIYIPSTVTSIGSGAFYQTHALTTIENFENCQITEIASKTFQSATKLTYIKIPNTVTTIGENAFHGNEKLALVYIPDTVTSIADTFTGSQPANAVYIYTGKDASALSACARLAGANIISRDEYDENATYTGVNLVVNYSNCLAYNNGVHGQTEIDTIVKSYLEPIEVVTKCILCEMYEKNEDIPALFVNKGHSTPEYEEGIIDISLAINIEAIEAYEAITGDTVEYGLFVVTQSILGENDIVDAEGNIFEGVCAITMPSRGYSIMTMKLHGFDTEAQKAAKFTFGAYVIDGTNTDYIQEGIKADGEKYVFTSYNDVYSNDEE